MQPLLDAIRESWAEWERFDETPTRELVAGPRRIRVRVGKGRVRQLLDILRRWDSCDWIEEMEVHLEIKGPPGIEDELAAVGIVTVEPGAPTEEILGDTTPPRGYRRQNGGGGSAVARRKLDKEQE